MVARHRDAALIEIARLQQLRAAIDRARAEAAHRQLADVDLADLPYALDQLAGDVDRLARDRERAYEAEDALPEPEALPPASLWFARARRSRDWARRQVSTRLSSREMGKAVP